MFLTKYFEKSRISFKKSHIFEIMTKCIRNVDEKRFSSEVYPF